MFLLYFILEFENSKHQVYQTKKNIFKYQKFIYKKQCITVSFQLTLIKVFKLNLNDFLFSGKVSPTEMATWSLGYILTLKINL